MSRITAVKPSTYTELVYDAGIVFKELDYSTATTAQELFDLIETAKDTPACLGATRGGITFKSSAEYRSVELDDIFLEIKGSKIKEAITVTVEMTLMELSPANAQIIVNASDLKVEGKISTLTERTYIDTEKDYLDNVIIVARKGTSEYVIIHLENVINTGEMSIKTNSKGEAEMPVTFTATISDVKATTAPYTIKFITN